MKGQIISLGSEHIQYVSLGSEDIQYVSVCTAQKAVTVNTYIAQAQLCSSNTLGF